MMSSQLPPDDSMDDERFSWEKWLRLGLRAFKKSLHRYNFGLPDAFWEHLENAFSELLAALRIVVQTARHRGQASQAPARPPEGTIDIEWEE